ncbi:hypothetical protein EMIT0111MI5_20546 [Burkholderia sp. IT-111MI5]
MGSGQDFEHEVTVTHEGQYNYLHNHGDRVDSHA